MVEAEHILCIQSGKTRKTDGGNKKELPSQMWGATGDPQSLQSFGLRANSPEKIEDNDGFPHPVFLYDSVDVLAGIELKLFFSLRVINYKKNNYVSTKLSHDLSPINGSTILNVEIISSQPLDG